MLAPLDNEVVFKTAFTDRDVFTCFVKDIVGINIQVDKKGRAIKNEIMMSILQKELSNLSKEVNQKDAWLKEAIDKRNQAEQENKDFKSNMVKNLFAKRLTTKEIVDITNLSLNDVRSFLD